MTKTSNLKYFTIAFLLYACNKKNDSITISNEYLTLVDSIMLYKEKPYSGTLFSKIDTVTTYKAGYVKGKKHGKELKFFFNGKLSESTFYTNGKKTGLHRAWWNNEQLMFEYHYDDKENYIGTQQEWFSNGTLKKELNYILGKESGTQKIWDLNGKLIANYQVINGERFGLISSNKCKPDNYVD